MRTFTLPQGYPEPVFWRLSVAPMIDVTDRHCRYFHRLLAPNALLYTEMISTGAILHGDAARHLDFDVAEQPVALQLGGSEPEELARAARAGERWGYQEINLNCGCPSERVQKGSFGACLMAEPKLVADCVKAMQDAVQVPVTVKHRLGLDYSNSYQFVLDFVGTLYQAGCRVFIVHARNAVLKGLSPKENRDIPPLRYDWALRLQHDFPAALFVLNGGIAELDQAQDLLATHDGVMLGRAAWHTPQVLHDLHKVLWPEQALLSEDQVIERMHAYASEQALQGRKLRLVLQSMMGWPHGKKGARQWRRTLSDPSSFKENNADVLMRAWEQLSALNP